MDLNDLWEADDPSPNRLRKVTLAQTPTRLVRFAPFIVRDTGFLSTSVRQRGGSRKICDETARKLVGQDRAEDCENAGQQQAPDF